MESSLTVNQDDIVGQHDMDTDIQDDIPSLNVPTLDEIMDQDRQNIISQLEETNIFAQLINSCYPFEEADKITSLENIPDDFDSSELVRLLHTSSEDATICRYRIYLLKALDRLMTFKELQEIENLSKDDYVNFMRDEGIVEQAMLFAAMDELDALDILLRRHVEELWTTRFDILNSIPETTSPNIYESLLPRLDENGHEVRWVEERYRELDWVERDEIRKALCRNSDNMLPPPSHQVDVSEWYIFRATQIESITGQLDQAQELIKIGMENNVPNLDQLDEKTRLLNQLVYELHPEIQENEELSLQDVQNLDDATTIQLMLKDSNAEAIVYDIRNFALPFLADFPRRKQSHETLDPMAILYKFILSITEFPTLLNIFLASRPDRNGTDRIIASDLDLARIILAVLYADSSKDSWSIYGEILDCLPSLEGIIAETSNEIDFKLIPEKADSVLLYSRMLSLDAPNLVHEMNRLEGYVETGEIFAKWGIPITLRFLATQESTHDAQSRLCLWMIRQASGDVESGGNKLERESDWVALLKDLQRLREPIGSARGLLGILTKEEVCNLVLETILSCGRFGLARDIFTDPLQKIGVTIDKAEELVLSCARAFYDNAESGNMNKGEMKMAYECLKVLPTTDAIQRELDLIEATNILSKLHLTGTRPGGLLPFQIRHHLNRLELVRRAVSSSSDAYRKTDIMIDLAHKLGFNDSVSACKVYAMCAEASVIEEDYSHAYDLCDLCLEIVKSLYPGRKKTSEPYEEASNICWRACFATCRHGPHANNTSSSSYFKTLERRLNLLGHALALCTDREGDNVTSTSTLIADVLGSWRHVEQEYIRVYDSTDRKTRAQADDGTINVYNAATTLTQIAKNDLSRVSAATASTTRFAANALSKVVGSAAAAAHAAPVPSSWGRRSDIHSQNSQTTSTDGFMAHQSQQDIQRSSSPSGYGPSGMSTWGIGMLGALQGGQQDSQAAELDKTRKRDMLKHALNSGLTSGVSWLLGVDTPNTSSTGDNE